jgi:hypothetical protein
MFLTAGLWPNPSLRAIAANPTDQALDEWFLLTAVEIRRGHGGAVEVTRSVRTRARWCLTHGLEVEQYSWL